MATNLELAQQAAVARYLTTQPTTSFNALSASTRPEDNVTGIGIGPKIVEGRADGPDSIRFYVERKVPRVAIPEANTLPSAIDGVPTDVIETGRFIAGAPAGLAEPALTLAPANMARTRLRPAQPGCSIGFQFAGGEAGSVMAGTFGALVQAPNGDRFMLSNNHVIANENALPFGSPIFQPGLLDGGNPATDRIARLFRFIAIDPGVSNLMDAAIARLDEASFAIGTFLPNIGRLASAAVSPPARGMAVEKAGRTTGFTTGVITDINATVRVSYSFGVAIFDDQVIVQRAGGSFSAAGDSGSLIVDSVRKQGTALLFAGSGSHTVGNKLAHVLGALGVSLVI